MIALLLEGVPRRGLRLLAGLLLALVAVPLVASDYLLTVLILILYFAYVGQAWNIMMGFAGQLSLGHALYVGLGAYAAAALYVHFGVSPWIGLWAAIAVSAAAGAVIGFLAFRFGVGGVYFAILTIAFAEFARIGFDHWSWLGGSAGFFLPVANYTRNDLLSLRGSPTMFYYVMLAMTVAAFVLCHALLKSRVGYYWLAIRESPEAAQALGIDIFRYRMVAVVISAAMTSLGGVLFAFYYNNLFPEQVFHISRSIELILGPIIGGIGTLLGPIVGAFLLTALSETLQEAMLAFGIDVPGIKQVFYGICLLLVVMFLPDGVWPPLAKRLRVGTARRTCPARRRLPMTALLEVDRISKSFSGLKAMQDVSFAVPEGAIVGLIGPNGAGKTTCFNVIAGVYRADAGEVRFAGKRIDGWRSDQICRAGVGRTFQLVKPFAGLTVMENVVVGALNACRQRARGQGEGGEVIEQLGLASKRDQMAASLTLPERKRLEVARALATGPRLLLLDEVMAGLRPTETDHMVALFRELNAKLGLTILLIEHVMRAVMALSSRLIVLHHGQVIAAGSPAEVTRDPAVLECYLGEEAV